MPRLHRPLRLAAAALAALLPATFTSAETSDRADLWGNAVAGSPGHATQLQRLAEAREADRSPARGRDFDRYDRSSLDRLRNDRFGERGVIRYRDPGTAVVISGNRDLRFGSSHPVGGLRERVLSNSDRHLSRRQRVTLGDGDVVVRGSTRGVTYVSPGTDRYVFDERVGYGDDFCPPHRTGFTRYERSGFGSSGYDRGFRDGYETRTRSGFRSHGFDRSSGASIEFRFGHRD